MLRIEFKTPQVIYHNQIVSEVTANDATLIVIKDTQFALINIPYVKWHFAIELDKINRIYTAK